MSVPTALLVVDVQNGAVALGPHRVEDVLATMSELVRAARGAGVTVIFVQHDDGPGTALERGTEGWEIHPRVAPETNERVVHKQHNSAFRETELHEVLETDGIRRLIVMGIQTEYCVDTTVRVAFELGYDVIVPRGGHTTYDNGDVSAAQVVEMYGERIFDGRFASVLSTEACRDLISGAASA